MRLWRLAQALLIGISRAAVILYKYRIEINRVDFRRFHMKYLILSASLILLSATALAPAAFAGQLSTPSSLSENATITQLVQHNRDVRSKK